MSDISKGVLIYNEWFEAMRALKPNDFKAIVLAIYDLQINDAPPPEFDGVARAIASIIFPYIERRKLQAQRGRAGAAARYSKEDDKSPANSGAISQNEKEINKSKSIYTQMKPNESAYPTASGGRYSGGCAAYKNEPRGNSSFDTQEFFEAAVKRSLGEEIGSIALSNM